MNTIALAFASLLLAAPSPAPAPAGSPASPPGGETIQLPPPQKEGGMPLMEALARRSTGREFAPTPLPAQVLSDLLWATLGVNRPESGKRTAPSARDWREITVYVALPEGMYRYESDGHRLVRTIPKDLRALTGKQDFVADAPVTLVFVADYRRMATDDPELRTMYAAADAAFASQNAYLYCASQGLATGVRAYVDRDALGKAMGLLPDEHVVFAQAVGYPKKK